MHVKEAAVHIDDLSMSNKNQIRFTRKTFLVEGITVTHSMNNPSDDYFGLGVAVANTRHVEASLFRVVNVDHKLSQLIQ